MDLNLLLKHLTWVLLIHFNISCKTCFCQYSRRYFGDRYSYERPGRYSRPDNDFRDWRRDYDLPRSPYIPHDEWSDYPSDYDETGYVKGYPYPDRGIRSYGASPQSINSRKMMKISDLSKLPNTHGKGGKKVDPLTEEVIKEEEVMVRSVSRRKRRDGMGKVLSSENCGGTSDLGERIVGGSDATEGAHPWIVAILKDGEAWCGGSIINKNWILTAAHCFMGDSPEQSTWAIRVGTINRNQGRTYKIKKVITHERFNLDNMLNSDIALMMTTKPIEYSKNIHPVCLPDNSYEEPRAPKVIVAGWGALKFDDENLPVILQDVTLNVVKDGECAKKYRQKKYTLYKSQFCTWNYKKDACQGDSGGPAVELVNGKATLIGVVSYGSTCADDFPGVYTQISYFLTWISTTMNENE